MRRAQQRLHRHQRQYVALAVFACVRWSAYNAARRSPPCRLVPVESCCSAADCCIARKRGLRATRCLMLRSRCRCDSARSSAVPWMLGLPSSLVARVASQRRSSAVQRRARARAVPHEAPGLSVVARDRHVERAHDGKQAFARRCLRRRGERQRTPLALEARPRLLEHLHIHHAIPDCMVAMEARARIHGERRDTDGKELAHRSRAGAHTHEIAS